MWMSVAVRAAMWVRSFCISVTKSLTRSRKRLALMAKRKRPNLRFCPPTTFAALEAPRISPQSCLFPSHGRNPGYWLRLSTTSLRFIPWMSILLVWSNSTLLPSVFHEGSLGFMNSSSLSTYK